MLENEKNKKHYNLSIIGAGSFGTSLACCVATQKNISVTLWGNEENVLREIEEKHTNHKYLKEVKIPLNVKVAYTLENTLKNADLVFFVVPSQAVREVVSQCKPYIKPNAIVVNFAKGLELKTHLRLSEVIKQVLVKNPIVIISGPSHAEELALQYPTSVVAASKEKKYAKIVQDLLSNEYLRVYTSTDVTGVEYGGILKNIIALAAGVGDGLGFGANTKAALITRGLLEMTRFGKAMGAKKATFQGLAGVGDLVVTATSVLSRNWTFGNKIGKGKTYEQAMSEMSMVVEGVFATKAVYEVAKEKGITMPITEEVYNILYNKKEAKQAVFDLMTRERKDENPY